MDTFYAEHDTKFKGWISLTFLVIFVPAMLWAFHTFVPSEKVPIPVEFVYVGMAVPLMLGICYCTASLRSKGLQRWIISESEIAYESPSPFLGKSFRMPISDFRGVEIDGDSDFARCKCVSGVDHGFHIGQIDGYRFYQTLVLEQERRAQVAPEQPLPAAKFR